MMRSSVVRPTFPIWGLTSHNVYLIASLKSNPVYQPTVSQRIHEKYVVTLLSITMLTFWCCILAVIVFTLFQVSLLRFCSSYVLPCWRGMATRSQPFPLFVLLYKGYVSLFLLTYLLCCLPHACYCIKLFGATFKVCLSRLWLFDYFNGKVRHFFKVSY